MERKVVFFASCGVGTDTAEAFIVPEGWTDGMLSDEAWQFATQHAESYGVYPDSDDEDTENPNGLTWNEVEGYWEEYDSEKHDGHLLYGYNDEVSWNQL